MIISQDMKIDKTIQDQGHGYKERLMDRVQDDQAAKSAVAL